MIILGRCEKMSEYYKYWEKNLFQAISRLVIKGLTTFLNLLGVNDRQRSRHLTRNESHLLLMVTAEMNPPDIVYRPALPDIYKFLSTILTNIVSSSKGALRTGRWRMGLALC